MKALLLRCLLVAVIAGPAIDIVSTISLFHGATKYEPGISEDEFHKMGNMTVNEMEATLAKRRVKMTRWDWLEESIPHLYFWKQVARDAIVPACGVFLACVWIGWVEQRHTRK
jgi:hypothetical protein